MSQISLAKSLRSHMTDAESLLWRHLRAHRLDGQKFKRQQPIGPYVVDFLHFGARIIVEADGGQHNASASDAVRDAWLVSQGFKVMRFWNNDILQNTEAVLATIMEAVAVAPSPPTPLPRGERGGIGALIPQPPTETESSAPSSASPRESPSPLAGEGLGRGGNATQTDIEGAL